MGGEGEWWTSQTGPFISPDSNRHRISPDPEVSSQSPCIRQCLVCVSDAVHKSMLKTVILCLRDAWGLRVGVGGGGGIDNKINVWWGISQERLGTAALVEGVDTSDLHLTIHHHTHGAGSCCAQPPLSSGGPLHNRNQSTPCSGGCGGV